MKCDLTLSGSIVQFNLSAAYHSTVKLRIREHGFERITRLNDIITVTTIHRHEIMRLFRHLSRQKVEKRVDPSQLPTQSFAPEGKAASENEGNHKTGSSFQEIPRILLIDLEIPDSSLLRSRGFNCTSGTLGKQVEVPKESRNDEHICLLNHDFPPNLHEFNILVVNLQNVETIPYDPSDHEHTYVKGEETVAIRSSYPQTIFDPRPFSGAILASKLSAFIDKAAIIIVFAIGKEEVSYEFVQITKRGIQSTHESTYNTYSFMEGLRFPYSANVVGKQTRLASGISTDFRRLMTGHNEEASYYVTFYHDTEWDSQQQRQVNRSTFVPLMLSSDNRIISYADYDQKTSIFVFPNIKGKGELLVELFETVLPADFPELFPYSTRFAWLAEARYQLPNEEALRTEKRQVEEEYSKKLEELDKKLHDNYKEYSWLHDLLTKTGGPLVKAVEHYFNWLGFPKVTNVDEEEPELREEDLRVELETGLMVVEVKGIGGTSTDSDCSQISKIRYRRGKERATYDVYGLYIVNHQLHLAPQDRAHPPFSSQQIEDAKNEERGLLTTYELFKLYFYIQNNFINKEDARSSLLEYGLVSFTPSNAVLVGCPLETHYGGTVVILELDNLQISKGAELIITEPHCFRKVRVIDIQIDGKSVTQADNGVVGVKIDSSVSLTSQIWIPTS